MHSKRPAAHLSREAPLEMGGDEFRRVGHRLVDRIAAFLDGLPQQPVTRATSTSSIRKAIGHDALPEGGMPVDQILEESANLLFDHSLFNGHPRFWGYITGSAAPIGALADLLASAVNPNVGAAVLSPMATEIEAQTVRWISDLIGYRRDCGGLLVSGGNAANFVGFLAARRARVTWDLPTVGLSASTPRLVAYVSKETHTWIEKAAELFGHGAASIRWIPVNSRQQMDVRALEAQIKADRRDGHQPFLIVGTAGTVSTGAIDPLPEIAAISRANALWFHVDGAYGAPAAALPDASAEILGLREADSVALDPHKWLYAPLEAGCVLVRDAKHLLRAFAHRPAYYNFEAPGDDRSVNYHEFGLQNSRGFRALKVWMALRQAGRSGYVRMISDDIALSRGLFDHAQAHPELEAVTQNLSITTFRYVPPDLSTVDPLTETYLNALNETLLNRLQGGGKAFVSNAVVQGKYVLRACIVNFRTTRADIEALPRIVAALGRTLDAEMRPDALRTAV